MLKVGGAGRMGDRVVRAADRDVRKLGSVLGGTVVLPVSCTIFHRMTLPSVWTYSFYCCIKYKGFSEGKRNYKEDPFDPY